MAPPTTELPPLALKIARKLPRLDFGLRYLWAFVKRWTLDRCPLMAAAMAFFGLLSLFPLMLASVAILSRSLLASNAHLPGFRHFINGFFPGAAGQILGEVDAVAAGTNTTTLGLVAIASLLWSGRAYFNTLASVLNRVWPNATQRSFWRHEIALWSIFLGVGALWLLSTAASVSLAALRAFAVARPQDLPQFFSNHASVFWQIMARIVSWLLTYFMFVLLYRFLPNVQAQRQAQRRKVVFGAALLGSVCWEAAKWFFTFVIGHNLTRYQATYGSVAGVVLTMIWIYFSSLILLLGAEAAAVYEEMCPAPGSATPHEPSNEPTCA